MFEAFPFIIPQLATFMVFPLQPITLKACLYIYRSVLPNKKVVYFWNQLYFQLFLIRIPIPYIDDPIYKQ